MLTDSIEIYKQLNNPSWDGVYIFGSIEINDSVKSFVKENVDDCEIELTEAQGIIIDLDAIDNYENLQIRYLPTRKGHAFFAKDFEDFLSNFNFRYETPDEFYISDIDSHYKDQNSDNNKLVDSYLKIISLYQLLEKISDHTEKDTSSEHRHIFLSANGKEYIPATYDFKSISLISKKLTSFNLEQLNEELFSLPHKSAKILLFKKSISQVVSGLKDVSKFPNIIEQFSEIVRNYRNNYELFLHEFSFEDEKEKLENKKQEYILKLNDILSGIHGKLLAVPVSLVLVAGQMKSSSDDNYMLVNIIILAGASLFAIMMWTLTINQLHSLNVVKDEYLSKKNRLKLQLNESLYSQLEDSFDQLDKRFKFQRNMIRLVDIIILLGLVVSILVFEYHTGLIYQWFSSL